MTMAGIFPITLINHQGLKTATGLQLQTPSPSIGLAYLGAYLKKHGYSYKAIDACGEALDQIRPHPSRPNVMVQGLSIQEVVDRVPADTRIVGMTCLFSHCWSLVEEMAAAIRAKVPNALFVVGGEHPTALPEHTLKTGRFDLIVYGEGEETFLELVQRIEKKEPWSDIQGILYRDANGGLVKNAPRKRVTSIDDFPYPDWDSWCIEAYIASHQVTGINLGRSMPFLGSRGCPYSCTFCSNENMWTRRYLMRSPKALVDEMEYMKNKYNVDGFNFMDLTFVINRKEVLAFCKELTERRLGIHYQLPAGTRCESFDAELATALEKSGLKNFAFAPESGSETILAAIKKEIRLPKFFQAVRDVLKTHMTVACFIVIGFPEDTPQTMQETLRLIRRLAVMGVHDVTVSKFTPYPGSVYFTRLQEKGLISKGLSELENVIDFYGKTGKSFCDSMTYPQLYRWMIWMFVNFYVISFALRPWRLISNLWSYMTEGVEKTRYVRFLTDVVVTRAKWRKQRVHATAA